MDLAIGIDIGYSSAKKTNGVVIIDRTTGTLPKGTNLFVGNKEAAVAHVRNELSRLQPKSSVVCIDGSFAPGEINDKVRLAERFFMSGPFASSGERSRRMRIGPAPTAAGSTFLRVTTEIIDALIEGDPLHHKRMHIQQAAHGQPELVGNVIEIFPTLFMASLLDPHPYDRDRSKHSDDLWGKLGGHQHLTPYNALRTAVESEVGVARKHDLRAAAISAIAADWCAGGQIDFIGHPGELGFVLPGEDRMNAAFRTMLTAHWEDSGGPPLLWL
jgi:hypothetical protein